MTRLRRQRELPATVQTCIHLRPLLSSIRPYRGAGRSACAPQKCNILPLKKWLHSLIVSLPCTRRQTISLSGTAHANAAERRRLHTGATPLLRRSINDQDQRIHPLQARSGKVLSLSVEVLAAAYRGRYGSHPQGVAGNRVPAKVAAHLPGTSGITFQYDARHLRPVCP